MNEKLNTIEVGYSELGGCLSLMLLVFTLGVANLLIKRAKKKWPRRLDSQGLTLFNGKMYPWQDVTRVEHVTTNVNGTVAHKYVFHAGKERFELPYERLIDQSGVMAFLKSHLHLEM